MKRALLTILILSTLAIPACRLTGVTGSGTKASDPRSVDPFTRIHLGSSADVRVTIGSPQSVVVETDDNLLPIITTEVKSGTLHIGSNKNYSTRLGVKITITAPELVEFVIAGSGDAEISGLAGERFQARIAGSGNLQASGSVQRVEANIAGSGDLNLQDLTCTDAEATIAGSGQIEVNPSASLKARINGSGDIIYSGNPKVDSKINGSGSIRNP